MTSVVINALPHSRGGGVTYLKNVLTHFGDDGNHYRVLLRPETDIIVNHDNVELQTIRFPDDSLPVRLWFEQAVLPIKLVQWDADVLYSPGDTTTVAAPCPVVLQIQNINPYYGRGSQNCSRALRAKFLGQRLLSRLSGLRAAETIFVSNHARKRANSFLKIPPSETNIVYHGVNSELFTVPEPPSNPHVRKLVTDGPKYLLCVSTVNAHKNFETLLRGFAALPEEIREKHHVAIAGAIVAEDYYESLLSIARAENIEQRVEFLGRVPHQDTVNLYHGAEAYVLPSKIESFGLTLVEAMACGTPVVASDAACIPEIVGDAAKLFDPDDPGDVASALQRVLTDDRYRERLARKGKARSERFSWERTATKVRTVLEQAAAGDER